jgi:hypothetical protein
MAALTFILQGAFGDNDVRTHMEDAIAVPPRRAVLVQDGPLSKCRAVGAGRGRSEQLPPALDACGRHRAGSAFRIRGYEHLHDCQTSAPLCMGVLVVMPARETAALIRSPGPLVRIV